jgi:hypothetical protein
MRRIAAGLLLVLLIAPFPVTADEFRPALLEISERDGGWVDVTWKVPMMGERVLALTPVLPDFLEQVGPGSGHRVAGAWIAPCGSKAWWACPRTLWCKSISRMERSIPPSFALSRIHSSFPSR